MKKRFISVLLSFALLFSSAMPSSLVWATESEVISEVDGVTQEDTIEENTTEENTIEENTTEENTTEENTTEENTIEENTTEAEIAEEETTEEETTEEETTEEETTEEETTEEGIFSKSRRIQFSTEEPQLLASFDFEEDGGDGKFYSGDSIADSAGTYKIVERKDGGNVLYLNGTSKAYLNITKSDGTSLLTGYDEITISYDAKVTGNSPNWSFYIAPSTDKQAGLSEHYLGAFHSPTKITVERFNNQGSRPGSISSTSMGGWHHYDIVFAQYETFVYIDGELVSSAFSDYLVSDILGDSSIIQIGKANWDSGEYYIGYIDNLEFYSGVLSEEQIADKYIDNSEDAGEIVEEPQLLAGFDFENDGGGVFYSGDSIATSAGTYELVEREGGGNALYLDGTSKAYLNIAKSDGTSLLTGYDEITISYDAKVIGKSPNWSFYIAPNANNQAGFWEHYLGAYHSSTKITVERYNNQGSRPRKISTTFTSGWHHFDVVFALDETLVYIDGELVSSAVSDYLVSDILGDSSIIQIGKANWGSGEYYTGYIDNLEFYSGALSEKQIANKYAGDSDDDDDSDEPYARILTFSDYQLWNSDQSAPDWDTLQSRLNSILDVIDDAGVTPDYLLVGGDYSIEYLKTSSQDGLNQVVAVTREKFANLNDDNTVLIQGNHDPSYISGFATTGPYYYDDFIIYAINEDDFPNTEYEDETPTTVEKTASDLKTWLEQRIEEGETRPILIASHIGLHFNIERMSNQYAYILFDVINEAAKQLDITFVFGHNHTLGDEQVGGSLTFYAKGQKLDITTEDSMSTNSGTPYTINFNYMNYGYIGFIGDVTNISSDFEPTTELTCSIITIYGDRIVVDRYSQDGLLESYTREMERQLSNSVTKYTVTYDVAGGEASVSDETIAEGTYVICRTVPTKLYKIFKGWADEDGNIYNPGEEINVTSNITLTAQWEELPEGKKYILTDTIKAGKKYILIYNSNTSDNSGTKYAVTDNGTDVNVTVISNIRFLSSNSVILLPDSVDESSYVWDAIWNQGANPVSQAYLFQNVKTHRFLGDVDNTLVVSDDPIGTELKASTSYSKLFSSYSWLYKDNSGYNELVPYNDSSRHIRYSRSNVNMQLSTYVDNSNVYLYEEYDDGGDLWVEVNSLESNNEYIIVNSNEAGSAKILTTTGREIGSLDVTVEYDSELGVKYIQHEADYDAVEVFHCYGLSDGTAWLDSYDLPSSGGILRLDSDKLGVTSSHAEYNYYNRFKYVDGKLIAYLGLDGTETRTMVYNNGFTVGEGEDVVIFKRVTALNEQDNIIVDEPQLLARFDFEDDGGGTFYSGDSIATSAGTYEIVERESGGNALYLDGTSKAYLNVAKSDGTSLLTGYDEITISYDAQVTGSSPNWSFYIAPNTNNQINKREHYLGAFYSPTMITVERYNNKGSRPSSISSTFTSGWHHFDVVFAQDETLVYIDGVLVSSAISNYLVSDILGDSSIIQIGKANWGSKGEYYIGYIDNLEFYSGALSEEQIADKYAGDSDDGDDSDEPYARILTFSDYQKWSSSWTNDWEVLKSQLTEILKGASDAGASPDYFLFGGDYSCLNSASESEEGMSQVVSIVQNQFPELVDTNSVLLQGNHDPADTSGMTTTGAHYFDDFIIYAINEDDFPTKQGDASVLTTVQKTADDLESWLEDMIASGESRPILIASHTGLHYDIDRADGNNQYAYVLFDAINEAAKRLDIVFLFGHNHTNGDEQVGGSLTFYRKGQKLNICTENSASQKSGTPYTLNFTYMNYGYVGYIGDIYNNASEFTPTDVLSCSIISIYDDRIVVDRYSKDGLLDSYTNEVARYSSDGTDVNKYTVTYDAAGGEASVANEEVTQGAYIICRTSPTYSGKLFGGWKEEDGNIYNPGDEINVTSNIMLTAQWEEIPEGNNYILTDTIKPGKKYILVYNSDINGNSGTKYAMTDNGNGISVTTLSDSMFLNDNSIINIPDTDDANSYVWDVIWNQGENPVSEAYLFQNVKTHNYLGDIDNTLVVSDDPIGTELKSSTTYSKLFSSYSWLYNNNNGYNELVPYDDSTRFIRYSVSGANVQFGKTTVSTDVNNSNVYLYEKVDDGGDLWVKVDSLESNNDYIIVSSKEAGSALALTTTGRTIGSLDVMIEKDSNTGLYYISHEAAYDAIEVFHSYGLSDGTVWLDSYDSLAEGGILRLDTNKISVTGNHVDDNYYNRFKYEDGKLVAYQGIAGTDTRTMVFSNGFSVGGDVAIYKRVTSLTN